MFIWLIQNYGRVRENDIFIRFLWYSKLFDMFFLRNWNTFVGSSLLMFCNPNEHNYPTKNSFFIFYGTEKMLAISQYQIGSQFENRFSFWIFFMGKKYFRKCRNFEWFVCKIWFPTKFICIDLLNLRAIKIPPEHSHVQNHCRRHFAAADSFWKQRKTE